MEYFRFYVPVIPDKQFSFRSVCKTKANISPALCQKLFIFLGFYSYLNHYLRMISMVGEIHGLELGFY